MATPSYIRVPPDSTGKKVDMCEVTVGAETVQRQRVQLAGDATDAIAGITLSGGVPVSSALTNPVGHHVTVTSVAAGGSDTLDSLQIPTSLTGKLVNIVVSGSVPFKAQLFTVTDGVQSSELITVICKDIWDYRPISKSLITVAQSAGIGFDGFRIVVKNLDTSEAADFYAAFFYDTE